MSKDSFQKLETGDESKNKKVFVYTEQGSFGVGV